MKLPYSWLKALLPELPQAPDLEPILANLGLPVEEIVLLSAPPVGVVYGEVLECTPLEGTHLFRVTVEAGEPAPVTIVTGAPNTRANVGVAVARPGTTIEGSEIGVRAVQGVASWGMLCSPKELGVGDYAGGLLQLPLGSAKTGTPLAELWPADAVIDIEVTPNRADALSVLGVARDLAAALDIELRLPSAGVPPQQGAPQPLPVTLTEGCDRFVARVASGVRNGPSPLLVQRRLLASGLRPIDLIVDASNYVMLELGQPTAFYDARDVALALRVERAVQGERTQTLYGDEIELNEHDLVIRNGGGEIVGVAGVIGANFGGIRSDTSDVVLEAAHFDPVSLRLTARRLGLKTDAVYRFERGVDPNLAPWAANRIMELLAQHGGAEVHPGVTDAGNSHLPSPIAFDPQAARDLLGLFISDDEMRATLEKLGCQVSEVWRVTPPSWRADLNIPEDLTEEVIRLHGYGELPETLPEVKVHESNLASGEEARARRDLKMVMAGLGFQEVVTYTFTNDEEAHKARAERPHLHLRNPLTSERTAMRTALYPSLLKTVQANAREQLLLFEVGRVFPVSGEVERFGALMRGPLAPRNWQGPIAGGFYTFKGLLEAAASELGAQLEVRALRGEEVPGALHPGIAGEVLWNGVPVGWLGALHPALASELGLKGETFLLEVRFPLPRRAWSFRDPRRTPANLRDLSIIAPDSVSYGELRDLLAREGGALLESIQVFDVFSGESIPSGHRSLAINLSFRGERTLQDADVDPVFDHLIATAQAQGWTVRGK
ncbi:phenylalanine--tRNA ligase subunit beta [Deinococcus peraridilitoris]|uniref:Phenylalanine--tRNA ligase beta subunit n=1 Tax=Deinococcus peraridilitoris (strain DSM 19664 / LMG 22246 / CIP 109416 / KR-200) TaxID=937777 RepID=L0A0D2_DEIPD|nr:phenylalanine--tRNA ligase subunit beta [Deinococcus peraridilitoris]AFZ66919.1 phenylalanyl-tRNA synthetase, beta subunit [Deinococcus peraridilitoris DSM 19664]